MKKHLFWLDLEMTGLNDEKDSILEVAVVVTDLDLNPVHEYQSVVFQPQSVLDNMNDWCKENHGKSGLTADVPNGKPIDQIENELIAIAEKYFSDRIVLVGNSIGNDRRFIDRYLKKFEKKLHYRMIDVSSFKEVYREKWGIKFEKKNAHRALGDVHESIAELKYYLGYIQVPGNGKSLEVR